MFYSEENGKWKKRTDILCMWRNFAIFQINLSTSIVQYLHGKRINVLDSAN